MAKKNLKQEDAPKEAAPLNLSALAPARGARHRRKRLGIGEGSGNGKTCGKGQKGQRSRSGYGLPPGFEGGQMPLYRRLPKVGFTSRKKVRGENVYAPISIMRLAALAKDGEVTLATLQGAGVVPAGRNARIKILGGGQLDQKLIVEAHAISASAKAAIESAGGSVRIVG